MTTDTSPALIVPGNVPAATGPLPVMFRAGRPVAITDDIRDQILAATAAQARTLLGDISEFQPNIADAAYLAWSKAVIIRAMYGQAHVDGAWYGGQRRALLWQGGALWMGIYQYLTDFQDAAAQAEAYCTLLGHLSDGEVPICDLEEGTGNQDPRWLAWRSVVMRRFPQLAQRPPLGQPQLYSGLFFAQSHGLAPGWLADYTSTEPSTPHFLWQFTDNYPIPGVGRCDCNIYHGTVGELAATARPAKVNPPPPVTEQTMNVTMPVLKNGMHDPVGRDQMVHRAQGMLRGVGIAWNNTAMRLTIDGIFGPATEAAVKAFQSQYGLPATGVLDDHTWPQLISGK